MELPQPPEPPVTLMDINGGISPISDDHDDKFGIPSLDDLGEEYYIG